MSICYKIFIGWFFERHPEYSPPICDIIDFLKDAHVIDDLDVLITDSGLILVAENGIFVDTDEEYTLPSNPDERCPETAMKIYSNLMIFRREYNVTLKHGLVHYFDCQ